MYDFNDGRTANNPGLVSITPSNASQLSKIWSFRTNGSIYSSPAVVNGTVYFGSWDGFLYALNSSNGALQWKRYLGQTTVPLCRGGATQGVTSSPEVWNNTVYVGGGNSSWYALNATTGGIVWNFSVGNNSATGGNYNWASPVIFDHELYIGIASNCDQPLVRGAVLELNLTGPPSVQAVFYTVPQGCVGASIWSSPAIDAARNTLWVTTGNEGGTCTEPFANSVIALNATTLLALGHYQVPGTQGLDLDFGDGVTFGTTTTGTPLALSTNKNGVTFAFNRSNVTSAGWGPRWSVATGSSDDWSIAPSVWNGTAFFVPTSYSTVGPATVQGSVWGLAPDAGRALWHVGTTNGDRLSPAYTNGVLVVPSGTNLSILASSTGKQLTAFAAPPDVNQFGPAAFAEGRLFAGTGSYTSYGANSPTVNGTMYAFGIPLSGSVQFAFKNGSTRAPETVDFWANSTGGSGGVSCRWDFGDGSIGTGCAPSHLYRVGGNLTAHVVLTDSEWDSVNLSARLQILPPVQPMVVTVQASATSGIAPAMFYFLATVSGAYTSPIDYRWSFGDGNTSTSSTALVYHTYTFAGKFALLVRAVDRVGNGSTAGTNVTVAPNLSLSGSLSPLNGSVPLRVEGTVVVSGGLSPYAIHWEGSDGSSSANSSYSTTLGTPGWYYVSVFVTDARGLLRSLGWNVTASVGPSIQGLSIEVVNQTVRCQPNAVTTSFLAVFTGGVGPFTYRWDFGDGSGSSQGPAVSHPYAASGSYTVTLTVNSTISAYNSTHQAVQIDLRSCALAAGPGSSGGWISPPVAVGALAIASGIVAGLGAWMWMRKARPRPTPDR
jgi:PKD repeat protein/outer membrane protein assembly factor BamB